MFDFPRLLRRYPTLQSVKCGADDNPTVGLILCAVKDEVVARYSILHESQQMFASKYMLYRRLRTNCERILRGNATKLKSGRRLQIPQFDLSSCRLPPESSKRVVQKNCSCSGASGACFGSSDHLGRTSSWVLVSLQRIFHAHREGRLWGTPADWKRP